MNALRMATACGIVGKLSADLGTLQAMTYLDDDQVTAIAVAPDTSVYVTDGRNSNRSGHGDCDSLIG